MGRGTRKAALHRAPQGRARRQTLAAGKGTLADADGLTKAHAGEPGFAYSDQWAWQVGNIEGDILGETSKTCTVSPTDAGKRIKVKALFDDDTGNAQGPVKSDATVVVPTPIPGRGDVLVSNIGQTGSTSGSLGNLHHAQQFTTGSDTAGYALTTVEVHFTGAPNSVSVKVATGLDSGTVAALSNPQSLAAGANTFVAFRGVKLAADTSYYVMVEARSGSVSLTASNSEDSSSQSGGSVTDKRPHPDGVR